MKNLDYLKDNKFKIKFPYDLRYWDKMIRQNSTTAEAIAKVRWNFVNSINAKNVLDYGCGPGWFRAFRPEGIRVDTYDIAPWPQTEITCEQYDLITFWDVFEHIENHDILKPLFKGADFIALAIPILPKDQDLIEWKHFKPGEHIHYFTEKGLKTYLSKYGFTLIKKGTPECPPRKDISSFLFKNKNSIH